jgi:DNA-binding CsgD family transcriptional regulator
MLRTNILEGQMPYNKDKPDFWDKTPETYAETPEYPDGVYLKADGKPDPRKGKLSNRQRTFAELIVEGVYSNAECARRAGFSEVTASDYATKLLNGVDFPHVVELITELREERQRKYGVTLIGQLTRLAKLSEGAEKSNQYSAAINAEKLRSAMGGLTIDRRETINTLDQLSRDEITAKLAELVKAPAPSCFHLFRGSQAIDLAQKPMSEVRGPRFSGLGEVWDALRLEAVDHFAKFAKSG